MKKNLDELLVVDAPTKGEDEAKVRISKRVKKKPIEAEVKIGTDGHTNIIRIPNEISEASGIKIGQEIKFIVRRKGDIIIKLKNG